MRVNRLNAAVIFAVSIAVTDLGRAQRFIERGYGESIKRYQGPMGEAISAPSRDQLGLIVEFHQSKQCYRAIAYACSNDRGGDDDYRQHHDAGQGYDHDDQAVSSAD